MDESELEILYKTLERFLSKKCVGCAQCASSEEICNLAVEIKQKIKMRLEGGVNE